MSHEREQLKAAIVSSTQQIALHSVTASEALQGLGVHLEQGLQPRDVEQRRRTFGRNALVEQPPRQAWLRFVDQLKSLLIIVLIAAAVLAASAETSKML